MSENKNVVYLPYAKYLEDPYERMQSVLTKWRTIVNALKEGKKVENVSSGSCAFCHFYYYAGNCGQCPINVDGNNCNVYNSYYSNFASTETVEAAQEFLTYLEGLALRNNWLEKIYENPNVEDLGSDEENLKASIKKWETVVQKLKEGYTVERFGTGQCHLCRRYWFKVCSGCPVYKSTGEAMCSGSPFKELQFTNISFVKPTPENISAAQREVDFLRRLLPKTKTLTEQLFEELQEKGFVVSYDSEGDINITGPILYSWNIADLVNLVNKYKACMFITFDSKPSKIVIHAIGKDKVDRKFKELSLPKTTTEPKPAEECYGEIKCGFDGEIYKITDLNLAQFLREHNSKFTVITTKGTKSVEPKTNSFRNCDP